MNQSEIKYRAWDKEYKMMLYNIQSYLEHKDKDGNEYDGYSDWRFCDFLENPVMIVMQYTRWKDKKGKEIYEGDLIKYMHMILIVGFAAGHFFIHAGNTIEDKYKENHEDLWKALDIEVIGNIYENKDLLNHD